MVRQMHYPCHKAYAAVRTSSGGRKQDLEVKTGQIGLQQTPINSYILLPRVTIKPRQPCSTIVIN